MKKNGQYTFAEISSQPAVWSEVLGAFDARRDRLVTAFQALAPGDALFIGCGSTYYLSQVAAALFQGLTGIPARAIPSSELLLFPEQSLLRPRRTLLVTISRSGTTTETVEAVTRFRQHGGLAVWVISCHRDSELVQRGDLALLAEPAFEQSVAQTRSFTSMLILVQALTAAIAGRDVTPLKSLPDRLSQLFDTAAGELAALARRFDLDRLFFLGSGYLYGIANEAMLKMKEMSLTSSEAFHFLEFRHGPMSMVGEEALVVGLLSDGARAAEERVLKDMIALGAFTLALNGPAGAHFGHSIPFAGPPLPSWASPVLYLPLLQLLAFHRSIAKGLDPDSPRNLAAVVSLDSTAFLAG
jgi:glucosamine--fructose-6-phosphate aminotransferase (isomerizing)